MPRILQDIQYYNGKFGNLTGNIPGYFFSAFTGLVYHDGMSLSWSDIEIKKDGNNKRTINRQKTDVITESFLPEQAIQ